MTRQYNYGFEHKAKLAARKLVKEKEKEIDLLNKAVKKASGAPQGVAEGIAKIRECLIKQTRKVIDLEVKQRETDSKEVNFAKEQ